MRQGQYSKRSRGRGGRKGGHSNSMSPNRVMDSNGPDVKVRGSAAHIVEKYRQLARDANAAGDRVAAENYLQHAEHYHRLLATMQEHSAQQRAQQQTNAPQPNDRNDRRDHAERENQSSETSEADAKSSEQSSSSDQNDDNSRGNSRANGRDTEDSEKVEARTESRRPARRKPKVVDEPEQSADDPSDEVPAPKPRRRARKADTADRKPVNETDIDIADATGGD